MESIFNTMLEIVLLFYLLFFGSLTLTIWIEKKTKKNSNAKTLIFLEYFNIVLLVFVALPVLDYLYFTFILKWISLSQTLEIILFFIFAIPVFGSISLITITLINLILFQRLPVKKRM